MNTVLVAEDVIHNDWSVNEDGRLLLLTLTKGYRVAVGLDHDDVDRFNQWSRLEGIRGYEEVLPSIVSMRGEVPRQEQIEDLRRRGYVVAFLVDSNPSHVANAMGIGVNGLLFAHAKYLRAEYRPGYTGELKPWTELVTEIEAQRAVEADLRDKEVVTDG